MITNRNFELKHIQTIELIGREIETPVGARYIERIIHFKNGAVVAYGDANPKVGFVWVMETCR